MTPDEWTDADPSGLRAAWRDDGDDAEACQRCGRGMDHDGDVCETCDRQVRLGR